MASEYKDSSFGEGLRQAGDMFGGAAKKIVGGAAPGMGSGPGGLFGAMGGAAGSAIGDTTNAIMAGMPGAQSQFHADIPDIQKQKLLEQIAQIQGLPSQTGSQQQALAQALFAQSRGEGPNPAQIALQQATNRNVEQNAGMMASQKGINPAVAQRLIAQNAARSGQEMAGQGALMQAQQQLSAQQQLGGVLGQERGQDIQHLGVLEQAQGEQNRAINEGTLGAAKLNQATASDNAKIYGQVAGGLTNAAGGVGAKMAGAAHGGQVDGNAEVQGDSPKNDTVPAMLSPGEIVIPRSAAGDADKAKEFIEHLKGMKGGKKSGKESKGYGGVLQAHRKLEDRVKQLEQMLHGSTMQ